VCLGGTTGVTGRKYTQAVQKLHLEVRNLLEVNPHALDVGVRA
jgi:hypothetical protein